MGAGVAKLILFQVTHTCLLTYLVNLSRPCPSLGLCPGEGLGREPGSPSSLAPTACLGWNHVVFLLFDRCTRRGEEISRILDSRKQGWARSQASSGCHAA